MRNEFVHELHLNPALTQQMFDEKWQNIIVLLTTLARFAGASVQQLLDSETQKILTQAIDAKKEREFTDEFNVIYGQIDEVYAYAYTCVRTTTVHNGCRNLANHYGVCTELCVIKQLEERQTNVEGELAGMKKNMVTMSRIESITARKIEELLTKKVSEAQVICT